MNGRRWIWILVCSVLCGCGSKTATVAIQGEVTYDGRPVEKGRIDFVPIENTPGPSAVGTIVNGRYDVSVERGLLPTGVYSVRIVAFRKTGATEPNRFDPNGPPLEQEINYIPAIYNNESALKVCMADLSDKNKVDFHLHATSSHTGR